MWYEFGGLANAQFVHQHFDCSSGLASRDLVTNLVPTLLPNIAVSAEWS